MSDQNTLTTGFQSLSLVAINDEESPPQVQDSTLSLEEPKSPSVMKTIFQLFKKDQKRSSLPDISLSDFSDAVPKSTEILTTLGDVLIVSSDVLDSTGKVANSLETIDLTSREASREALDREPDIEEEEAEEKPHTFILNDIKDVANIFKKAKNIIVLVGAGISTSAGIPDFRTPGTGIYSNLEQFDLPYAEAIFDLQYFRENPTPFFTLVKDLLPGTYKPTFSHFFCKLLQEKNKLKRMYTQNIDALERLSGIDPDFLVEAHGTFHTSHCLECKCEYSLSWLRQNLDKIPLCERCEGIVKPDIVFYGENLPMRFYEACTLDFNEKVDLLLVLGTSLEVEPFASLVARVEEGCPRVLINREICGFSNGLFLSIDHQDYFLKGDCDAILSSLVDKCGWREHLDIIKEARN